MGAVTGLGQIVVAILTAFGQLAEARIPSSQTYPISVSVLAGVKFTGSNTEVLGTVDGTGSEAKFYALQGACLGADGYSYWAESGYEPNGAGLPDLSGYAPDGSNGAAMGTAAHVIRRVNLDTGAVTTIIGSAGQHGDLDGTGTAARFNSPNKIYAMPTGILINDYRNGKVKFATYDGVTTTIGTAGMEPWNMTGPCGDSAGNVFVLDYVNGVCKKIAAGTGTVTTVLTDIGGAISMAMMDDDRTVFISCISGPIIKGDVVSNTTATVSNLAGDGLCRNAAGTNVYFCGGGGNGGVWKMSTTAPYTVTQIAVPSGTFNSPVPIMCRGNDLFVGDLWGSHIVKITNGAR